MSNSTTTATAKDVLRTWALVTVYGHLPTWRPVCDACGDIGEEWGSTACRHVESFFIGDNRKRWRGLALRLIVEHVEWDRVMKRDKVEWQECCHRFRRWYIEHPLHSPKEWE